MESRPANPSDEQPADEKDLKEKPRKTLPMVSVPDDREVLAQEMAEMFEEDEVTHQHGSSEPEAD